MHLSPTSKLGYLSLNLTLTLQESLRQHRMTRFYLQQMEDPHGPHVAIFIGNLPTSLSQRQYEKILLDILGKGNFIDVWILSNEIVIITFI